MHNLQPLAMARHGMYLNGERFLEVSGRGVLEVSQRKGQGARSITPVRSQRAGDKPRPAAIWLAAGGTRGRPPLSPETEYATEKSRGNRAAAFGAVRSTCIRLMSTPLSFSTKPVGAT